MSAPDAVPAFADEETLLPVIVQDADSGVVLMLAYMNREAWRQTVASGVATYFSRSRGRLWTKGETSGHVQRVREIRVDCDADAILLKVEQAGGAACHEGYQSCFFRQLSDGQWNVVERRVFNPQSVYKSASTDENSAR
jgi:phosphoribosyl-AMP cyclohydrolase